MSLFPGRRAYSDVSPTLGESIGQVVDGLRLFGLTSHPGRLLSMMAYALPRYGLSPAAAIMGPALTWGNRTALIDDRGSMSYRQLGAAVGRLAAGLDRAGIGAGTRVGLMADDDRYLLIVMGAVGLCGGTVWPVNPRLGSDDVRAWLDDNRIEVVIHADHCASSLSGWVDSARSSMSGDGAEDDDARPTGSKTPGLDGAGGSVGTSHSTRPTDLRGGLVTLSMTECDRLIAVSAGLPVPMRARQSHFVLLTGGTTAVPSSIPITARWSAPVPILALAGSIKVRHGAPVLVCAPCFHGYGLAVATLALVAGSPLVMSSVCRVEGLSAMNKGGTTGRLDWGEAIFTVVSHHQVATIVGVPAQLRSLAAYLDQTNPPRTDEEQVVSIVSGSDRLEQATIDILQRRWGPVLVNYYGTTESGTVTMISGSALQAHPGSLGRPVATTRIRILGRQGLVLPRGQIGRIQVFSPLASQGSRLTGAAFLTSDLGWVDAEGYLYLKGRLGAGKAGGEFINPSRVESVLTSLDGIVWARAWLVPDQKYGQRVVAEVGLAGGCAPDPEYWRQVVRTRLGPPSVPARITVRNCHPARSEAESQNPSLL